MDENDAPVSPEWREDYRQRVLLGYGQSVEDSPFNYLEGEAAADEWTVVGWLSIEDSEDGKYLPKLLQMTHPEVKRVSPVEEGGSDE